MKGVEKHCLIFWSIGNNSPTVPQAVPRSQQLFVEIVALVHLKGVSMAENEITVEELCPR